VKLLLDTHFLLWLLTASRRLKDYPWLLKYQPWGISPVSLLEIQFLSEIGRVEAQLPELSELLAQDPRFCMDDLPLIDLVRAGIALTWTRDPFDRLICAHSQARRLSLCTADDRIIQNHGWICRELRTRAGR
jgi:YD repeat-containing protein